MKFEVADGMEICLVIIFRQKLGLSFIEIDRLTKELEVDGEIYSYLGLGDWISHYDWLRDKNGNVLGIRHIPLAPYPFSINRLERLPYVKSDGESLEIYFGDFRDFEEDRSVDQDFGANFVYRTTHDEYLMTFRTSLLTENELESLRKAEANWVQVFLK
jgi:hypothetical protein